MTSNNIDIVQKLNKACENKDFEAAARLLHSEYTFKDPKMSFSSPEEFVEFMKVCPFTGRPENIRFIAEGDTVVQIFDCVMTEPISFTFRMCDVLRLKDGKVIEEEAFYDTAKIPKDAADIAEKALQNRSQAAVAH